MIIALCGRKGSGKTELAKYCKEEYDAEIISFGTALKELTVKLLGYKNIDELNEHKNEKNLFNINPDSNFIRIINEDTGIDMKIIYDFLNKKTFTNIREILQIIGTELIRKCNPNWHVKKLVEKLRNIDYNNKLVIVDDCRFLNEKNTLEHFGANFYFIIRPLLTNVSNHISETELKWYNFYRNEIIINDKDIEFLKKWWKYEIDRLINKQYKEYNEIISEYISDKFDGNSYSFMDSTNKENKLAANRIIENVMVNEKGIISTNGDELIEKIIFGNYKNDISNVYNPFIIENLKSFL